MTSVMSVPRTIRNCSVAVVDRLSRLCVSLLNDVASFRDLVMNRLMMVLPVVRNVG